MKNSGLGPLPEGGRVVVIGGGPGGTSTAIAIKQGARALGRNVSVTVVEGKQFNDEQHYNQCTGVFAPPIVELVEQRLQVPFPHHLRRNIIDGYILHTPRRSILLDGETHPSVALRRIQFDEYMLSVARQCGVQVLQARATNVEFHDDHVLVYTENAPLKADVVVGAFGMDEGTGVLFERTTGYRPPPALNSIVTKFDPGEKAIAGIGNHIHAFLPSSPRIEFGAVTPKSIHLTINIAGASVDSKQMLAFLGSPLVLRALPCLQGAASFYSDNLHFFKGGFPCGLARNFSGDRYVMVGDAAGLVRAFKGKGVTSAVKTGLRAAEVILKSGISGWAFQEYHAANRDITSDLHYGQAMRRLAIFASAYGFMDAVLAAAEHNGNLRRALFNAVSAHGPYREVILAAFSPSSLYAVFKAFLIRKSSF